jgi:sirohydrochlorin ferrochelatase
LNTGIVIFAHGSSIASANDAVRKVAADVASRGGFDLVEAAFLEGGEPSLAGAAERLRTRGAARILVIPYFLTLGLHLQRDLPRLAAEVSARQDILVEVAPPLDGHPALANALVERANAALKDSETTRNA